MSSTNYSVQLFSEEDTQHITGVVQLKEVGDSIYVYGEQEVLMAVYEKNDIQKMAPYSNN